jgi:hypothetical protein
MKIVVVLRLQDYEDKRILDIASKVLSVSRALIKAANLTV